MKPQVQVKKGFITLVAVTICPKCGIDVAIQATVKIEDTEKYKRLVADCHKAITNAIVDCDEKHIV